MNPDVRIDGDCFKLTGDSEIREVSLSLYGLEEREETLNAHPHASVCRLRFGPSWGTKAR